VRGAVAAGGGGKLEKGARRQMPQPEDGATEPTGGEFTGDVGGEGDLVFSDGADGGDTNDLLTVDQTVDQTVVSGLGLFSVGGSSLEGQAAARHNGYLPQGIGATSLESGDQSSINIDIGLEGRALEHTADLPGGILRDMTGGENDESPPVRNPRTGDASGKAPRSVYSALSNGGNSGDEAEFSDGDEDTAGNDDDDNADDARGEGPFRHGGSAHSSDH